MKLLLICFLIFQSHPLGTGVHLSERWIVWNVGQGLWITGVFQKECLHIDAGGEKKPGSLLKSLCHGKENSLFLSHWDWDHIGGVSHLQNRLPNLCRVGLPGGKVSSRSKIQRLMQISECSTTSQKIREVIWQKSEKSPNHMSRVWTWENQWLFPGDSPQSEERKWIRQLKNPEKIRFLIAGHHGSRTSTSPELLRSLRGVRTVVISARKKIYGHPHPKVMERLAQKKIPTLRTEEWGHLIFEI